ncbi:hypothetical protein EDD18DRAFT_778617 [Armillaria luteobubalina]|uniref:DUF1793 domain-containing protein n=1 Tax=Armillaria luteobubalina TaxID=153913 RepID=A0AA39QD69_9AGAR|nr:hypothetical protein EDD18DRAFT_778617 [Armillaria luteobubalina]
MFTAGASNDTTVRDALISLIHMKAGSNVSAGVFPLTYDPNKGTSISGQASPGQGAMFSLMTLRPQNKIENQTNSGGNSSSTGDHSSSNNDQTSSSSSNASPIAGGVVGGLVFLTLLVFGVLMYRRRQRRKYGDTNNQRSARDSSTRGVPPYSLYGSRGSQNSSLLVPLRAGQQSASIEPYPLRKGGQPIILSSITSELTVVTSTPFPESSSSVNRDERFNSDNATTLQLRREVESLRREMDEMQARGLYEPPPQYA